MEILYEDEYLIAINKPAGLASVPGPKIPEKNTLMGKVRAHFHEKGFKPYILHRLDRETSGIVLFGKFPRNRAKLEEIFKEGGTEKTYFALVKGVPRRNGIITFPLDARHTDTKVPAVTKYRVIKQCNGFAVIEAKIQTGRRHQIRKHFAMIEHPLVNDFEYGERNFNRKFQRQYGTHFMFLHAGKIRFKHPFTEKILEIETSPPKNFQKILAAGVFR